MGRPFASNQAAIRNKCDPTPRNIDLWWRGLEGHVGNTGCVDVSPLVFPAHLGLVEEAYQAAERARLGPAGPSDDVMSPDGH